MRNPSGTVTWKQKVNRQIWHTCSGPLGGTGRLILPAGTVSLLLAVCMFFLSSIFFSEFPIYPCPLLSTGLCQCVEAISSRPLEGDIGFPSFATHLLSSYLKQISNNHKSSFNTLAKYAYNRMIIGRNSIAKIDASCLRDTDGHALCTNKIFNANSVIVWR